MLTMLLYLQEPDEGGETEFPGGLGRDAEGERLTVAPREGRVLFFHNCVEQDDDAWEGPRDCPRPHPASRHAGLPVVRGEKWAVNLWVREYETKRSGGIYRAQAFRAQGGV